MKTTTSEQILLVDDDTDLLAALRRTHRKAYNLTVATGGPEALDLLARTGPFALVVSDCQMPVMDGIAFLARVREAYPDTVRVMLTGNADRQSAIDAVNKGHIFRFLNKPCPKEVFASCLDAGLEQYRLRTAEQFLLEQTVRGSIGVMADVLSLASPRAFGRATRILGHVRHVVTTLKLRDRWQYETAALLSQIGCIAIPSEVFECMAAGQTLTPEQSAMMSRHPEVARDLLSKIPRLQMVSQIVYQQDKTEKGRRPGVTAEVELGGRILAAALEFDELMFNGAEHSQALAKMRAEGKHNSKVLDALSSSEVANLDLTVRLVPLDKISCGMVIEEDIRAKDEKLIVARGHELTKGSLERLKNFADLGLLAKQELRVRVTATESGELEAA